MPLSFQTHKSNQEISQIIDNLAIDKNTQKLAIQEGGKTSPVLTTGTGERQNHNIWIFKDKTWVDSASNPISVINTGITEEDRNWNLIEILPPNFNVKEVTVFTYNAVETGKISVSKIKLKTIDGDEIETSATVYTGNKGFIFNIERELFSTNHNIKTTGNNAQLYGFELTKRAVSISKILVDDIIFPENENAKYVIQVRGYYDE